MTPWGAEEEIDGQALFGRTVLQIAPALDASPLAFLASKSRRPGRSGRPRAGRRRAGAAGQRIAGARRRFPALAAAARNPWTAGAQWSPAGETRACAKASNSFMSGARRGVACRPSRRAKRARSALVAEFERGRMRWRWTPIRSCLLRKRMMEAAARRGPRPRGQAVSRLAWRRSAQLFSPEAVEAAGCAACASPCASTAHRLIVALGLEAERLKFSGGGGAAQGEEFFRQFRQEARFRLAARRGRDSRRRLRGRGRAAGPRPDGGAASAARTAPPPASPPPWWSRRPVEAGALRRSSGASARRSRCCSLRRGPARSRFCCAPPDVEAGCAPAGLSRPVRRRPDARG